MQDTLLKFTSRNHITDRWLAHNPDAKYECWYCGKLNEQTDPKQKYCNRSCAKKYWRRAHKKINYGYCDWCGDEFIRTRIDKQYCEKKCLQSAQRKRRGIPVLAEMNVPCRECSATFTPTHVAQRYCNLECCITHRLADKREYNHWHRLGKKNMRGFTNRYRDWLRREIRVSIENVKAVHEVTIFDKDDWNRRAKEIELKLAAKYN